MLGKRKNKKTTRMDTLIGPQSQVIGDIKFAGGLHIEGSIKGSISAEIGDNSLVQLGEQGTIEGQINVPFVVINGMVAGDVYSSEHIELAAKARITGNVYYNLIEISVGAEVNGKLVHAPAGDSEVALIENQQHQIDK